VKNADSKMPDLTLTLLDNSLSDIAYWRIDRKPFGSGIWQGKGRYGLSRPKVGTDDYQYFISPIIALNVNLFDKKMVPDASIAIPHHRISNMINY